MPFVPRFVKPAASSMSSRTRWPERLSMQGEISLPEGTFEKSTAVGFAFSDAAGYCQGAERRDQDDGSVKVKGGFMGKQALNAAQVKALASLPPLPVVRAQLLGVLQAPPANWSARWPNQAARWRLSSRRILKRSAPLLRNWNNGCALK